MGKKKISAREAERRKKQSDLMNGVKLVHGIPVYHEATGGRKVKLVKR